MSEKDLITIRREKHQELNNGTYPLASRVGENIVFLLERIKLCTPKVSLNHDELGGFFLTQGRIFAIRKSGGITFIKIVDSTGCLQLIASKSTLSDYSRLHLLDLGDIIEVTGKLCLSKTNEPSLLITEWLVLTKSHLPPPEKYAGVSDIEIKYRQRYLDLMSSEESRAVFIIRSYILRGIRDFMDTNGFVEMETSTLNVVSSGANAIPFTTHHNALNTDLYLRIAPELYLKRLLVGGYDKVYEIGRSYRNEGLSTRHNPEFSMLEFYQAYGNFELLFDYTKRLLNHIDNYIEKNLNSKLSPQQFAYPFYQKWKNERGFTFSSFKIITMLEAVVVGLQAAELVFDENEKIFSQLKILNQNNQRLLKIDFDSLCQKLNESSSPGERLFLLFEEIAEPFLVEDYNTIINGKSYSLPVFITQYPSDVCPLARKNDLDSRVCDRFELFIDGRELSNAFQELNNPDEQANRFQEQLRSNQKDPMGYDADYIEALKYGMPPAIGFGMGVDRLCCLICNQPSIKDVLLFPTLKPKQ